MDKISNVKQELHSKYCGLIHNTYIIKNKAYGDSFGKTFKEYGPAVLCLRLEDKLNRAKQILLYGSKESQDEKVKDTLLDLANYAIMSVMELELKSPHFKADMEAKQAEEETRQVAKIMVQRMGELNENKTPSKF